MNNEFPFQDINQANDIFNNLTQAIIGINEKGDIDYLNTKAEKIFDFKTLQIVGKNITTLIPDGLRLIQNRSQSTTNKTEYPNIICFQKNGSQFPIHLSIIDISTQSKRQYVFLIREVSIQKQTSNSLQVDFISLMSHELKSPLTSIIGYLDIILEGDTGPINDEQKEFLTIVSQDAIKLDEMITNLSLINKIESGKIILKNKRFDLSQLLLNISNSIAENPNQKKIHFKHVIPSGIFIEGDGQLLHKAINNLISNAFNYTLDGTIELKTVIENQQINISVKDTGIGISEEDQGKLFTKFFRSDNKHVRSFDGAGLGLATVNKIIESHYGKIIAKSNLGKGSVFTIVLPFREQI
jgi:PAS domain S-box-containing protein